MRSGRSSVKFVVLMSSAVRQQYSPSFGSCTNPLGEHCRPGPSRTRSAASGTALSSEGPAGRPCAPGPPRLVLVWESSSVSLRSRWSSNSSARSRGSRLSHLASKRQPGRARRRIARGHRWLCDQLSSGGDLFVTIDIDGLDPSVAPATGWPQPGGLSFRQVAGIITGLARAGRIIGGDVVELLPCRDVNGVTPLTATRLLMLVVRTRRRQAGSGLPRARRARARRKLVGPAISARSRRRARSSLRRRSRQRRRIVAAIPGENVIYAESPITNWPNVRRGCCRSDRDLRRLHDLRLHRLRRSAPDAAAPIAAGIFLDVFNVRLLAFGPVRRRARLTERHHHEHPAVRSHRPNAAARGCHHPDAVRGHDTARRRRRQVAGVLRAPRLAARHRLHAGSRHPGRAVHAAGIAGIDPVRVGPDRADTRSAAETAPHRRRHRGRP
jgi:hypothetical protein